MASTLAYRTEPSHGQDHAGRQQRRVRRRGAGQAVVVQRPADDPACAHPGCAQGSHGVPGTERLARAGHQHSGPVHRRHVPSSWRTRLLGRASSGPCTRRRTRTRAIQRTGRRGREPRCGRGPAYRHATRDGIDLQVVSAFRSIEYQLGILERKLARGQTIDEILRVSAAPGYSEHHSGRAVDLTTPGFAALEEDFERSPAFAWLMRNASPFGFALSYPRGNPHGIAYEPWHWCWHPAKAARHA